MKIGKDDRLGHLRLVLSILSHKTNFWKLRILNGYVGRAHNFIFEKHHTSIANHNCKPKFRLKTLQHQRPTTLPTPQKNYAMTQKFGINLLTLVKTTTTATTTTTTTKT